jgi:hypothetical protein
MASDFACETRARLPPLCSTVTEVTGEKPDKPIAYCRDCDLLFRYEAREIFVGENFCPRCSGRAAEHFKTVKDGRSSHRSAEMLKD